MPFRHRNLAFAALVLLLMLTACSGGLQPQPPAPSPSSTPFIPAPPTATFAPTATPSPTTPPTPTATATPSPTPTPATTTFLFVGNIVPARCVRAAADKRGDDHYIYAQVAPLIRKADFAVALLNTALTQSGIVTGCRYTFVLTGDPKHAHTLAWAGFDLVNIGTNHIRNCGWVGCGYKGFLETLQNLHAAGLPTVGGGLNLDAALQPYVVTLHGVRFAFVSLNQLGFSWADTDTPGTAPLTPENARRAIALARQQADVVIALPHWGPEYDATPDYLQRRAARWLVEAGADVIVGNHSHVVQGMQILGGVPVFYSLGNFVFDQTWSQETQQGAILTLTFEGQNMVSYAYTPVHIDGDGTVHVAPPKEAQAIMARIRAASLPSEDVP